jgi:hypothetical protein
MTRKLLPALLSAILFVGCSGPSQLARKSEKKLDQGDHWRAWALATRALDKAPANPEARAAATRAAQSIADDWRRRIHATAGLDSTQAADQVLEFAAFRLGAARYVTVATDPVWEKEERALRLGAARRSYSAAQASLAARRPKKAHLGFMDADRYAPGYRDAAARAASVLPEARSRIAFVPLQTTAGRAIWAATWRLRGAAMWSSN